MVKKMRKDDFKEDMKQIFDEALEDFSKQEVKIPHQVLKFECPSCVNKHSLKTTDYPMFKCDKCGCEARLQFLIMKKGKEE